MSDFIKDNKKDIIILIFVILIILTVLTYKNVNRYIIKHTYVNIGEDEKEYGEFANLEYEANEYTVVNVNNKTLMLNYYNDFINMIVNNPDESWNYLTEEYKEKFTNIEEYKKYLKEEIITVNTLKNSISKYDIDGEYNNITITLVDTDGYYYVFYLDGIWNYKVKISGKY